jgi:hypothetical protein
MKLEKKLKRIIAKCERSGKSDHKGAKNQLIRAMHKAAKKIGKSEISLGLQSSIDKIVNTLKDSADFVDAAEHVKDMVFRSTNGFIHDIRIKPRQQLNAYLDQLQEEFQSGKLSFRPYVYVLWRAKSPNRFYYIGRATDDSRLLGTRHTKLAASLPLCTNISIVFPGVSNDDNIRNLEASLIRLVEFEFGEMPVNNDKRENLDTQSTSNSLVKLARFFTKIGKDLDPVEN